MKKEKRGKRTGKGKMRGGYEGIKYDAGGPGGNLGDLAEDIVGTIVYTINSITNSIGVVTDLIELPADMGTAFSAKNAPNPNDVNIKGY